MSCGITNCPIVDSNADRVACKGICGKSFHAICVGLNKRNTVFLKVFSDNLLFFCDECKIISLSHVLLAIKCLSDSNDSYQKNLTNKITVKLANLESSIRCVDDLGNSVQTSTEQIKSKLINMDKQIAGLTESVLARSMNDETTMRHFNTVLSALKANYSALITSNQKICESINSLREDIDIHFQSSSDMWSNKQPSPKQPDPMLEVIFDRINGVGDELAAAQSTIFDIGNHIETVCSKIDDLPIHSQNNPNVHYNTSILAELLETEVDSLSPPPPRLQRMVQSAISPAAPTIQESETVLTSTPPVAAPRQLINQFGTTWTPAEWRRRLDKLRSENHQVTTLLIKGTPRNADVSWITQFFEKKYGITISQCKMILPSHHKSNRSFKFDLPIRYEWLFRNPAGVNYNLGKMRICKWMDRTTKKQDTSNISTKSNSRNKFPRPASNSRPKSDSNWSLKTNIFPNFSPPTRIPNQPSTHQSSNALIASMPPKPPRQRVSFNLTPTSHPVSSQPSTPSTHAPTSNSFPNFDLKTGAKYPNFISSHILNPTSNVLSNPSPNPSSNTPSSTISPSSTPILDPLLPPTVKLTQQTIDTTECRYALSRLREKKIYENIRLFLAYLHNKSDSVCYEGKTKTSVMVSIQQEGLPTDPISLKNLYIRYHEIFNMSPQKVADDLAAFGNYVHSKRVSHLQRSRVDHNKFFRP